MDLVGRFISERSGNDSGRIESLLIDDKTGKIEYFLIEGSPNFDLGGRIVAVMVANRSGTWRKIY
jgi:sporulation protein YlmC with PRC-barrel domain